MKRNDIRSFTIIFSLWLICNEFSFIALNPPNLLNLNIGSDNSASILTPETAMNIDINNTFVQAFNQTQAFLNIEKQINFGYRIPGTLGHNSCINWISESMNPYGINQWINFSVNGVPCAHLLTKLNPGHNQTIIFAAHYDSRAIAEKDPDPENRATPIDGANDGASGVAVMMEMVKVLSIEFSNLNSTISISADLWFLFIDAEDQGNGAMETNGKQWDWCEGSSWLANDMANHPAKYFSQGQTIDNIAAFILLDMVGGPNLEFIRENHSNNAVEAAIFDMGRDLGYSTTFSTTAPTYNIEDDHVPFANQDIPTCDLIINFWNNPSWPYHHTLNDTLENINPESLGITGRTLLLILQDNTLINLENTQNTLKSLFDHPIVYIFLIIFMGLGILIGVIIMFSKQMRFKIKVKK
ncbi:MAG: M28 family peptidase [Promethearchaeota archaeon]